MHAKFERKPFNKRVNSIKVPPLKCQGIKTKLVNSILANVKWSGTGKWIEPFLGSGVVLFNALPSMAIASDINPCIIDFYSAIVDGIVTPVKTRRFLEHHGRKLEAGGKEYYDNMRDQFNNDRDPLKFLFLSRSCYNGLMRFNLSGEFNSPFCHKPGRFSTNYITKIEHQVMSIREILLSHDYDFECKPWKEVVSIATETDFVYMDPPYSGRNTGYFGKWKESDDIGLIEFIKNCPCNCMMSTWKESGGRMNPLYHDLDEMDGVSIIDIEHHYHVGSTESLRNPVIEAIAMKKSGVTSIPVES